MSGIHVSDTIFVSDLDEVSNVQENTRFFHMSSTSGSQGCASDQ